MEPRSTASNDWVGTIRVEHDGLFATLESLDLRLAGAAASEPSDAEADVRAIDGLTRCLAEHFEGEESGGYLPDIYEFAPRYSGQADRLLAEHADLLSRGASLANRVHAAADNMAIWSGVLEEFRVFTEGLRQHEESECLLMERALMEDIGG